VLRFRLMVNESVKTASKASEGESAAWTILLDWTFRQGDEHLLVDDAGKIVGKLKVASEPEGAGWRC